MSGSVTAEISRSYDSLGRLTSYTDADSVTATTTYDILSRPATTNDGKATRTYTYDGGTERRGLLTQVVDSQTGTFTASYDGRGEIAHQTWPTGVTTNQYYDETGQATGIEYLTNSSCTTSSCTLYTNYIGQDAHSLNRWDSNTLDSYGYVYDNADRLVDAAHTTTAGCILREYTFDTATNRTKLARYGPEPTNCADTTLIDTHTSTYDAANRITNSGYTYDALGRTLTIPSADTVINNNGAVTLAYHVNDLVDTITQNGRTTDYALDPIQSRIRSWTDTTTGTTPHVNHYDGDDDNPSWTQETTTAYTRPFAGVDGIAGIYNSSDASIDYQITNLHDDVVATIHNNATGLSTTQSATEYGVPNNSANAGTIRYGWLGADQRAGDTPAGIVLIGVSLYNPATGRFLQKDPVYGGSCNAYDYVCQDPVNDTDLSGQFALLAALAVVVVVAVIVVAIAYDTAKATPVIVKAIHVGVEKTKKFVAKVADKVKHIWHAKKKKQPRSQKTGIHIALAEVRQQATSIRMLTTTVGGEGFRQTGTRDMAEVVNRVVVGR